MKLLLHTIRPRSAKVKSLLLVYFTRLVLHFSSQLLAEQSVLNVVLKFVRSENYLRKTVILKNNCVPLKNVVHRNNAFQFFVSKIDTCSVHWNLFHCQFMKNLTQRGFSHSFATGF